MKYLKFFVVLLLAIFIFNGNVLAASSVTLSTNKSSVSVGETFNVSFNIKEVAAWDIFVRAYGPVNCVIDGPTTLGTPDYAEDKDKVIMYRSNTTEDAENTDLTYSTTCTTTGEGTVELILEGSITDKNDNIIANIRKTNSVTVENKYTITFNSDGGSSVAAQTVNNGGKVIKPTNPTKEGYTFKEWQLNGTAYDFNSTVSSNLTLKAVWTKNAATQFTVSFDSTGGSSVAAQTVNNGGKATIPVNPTKEGFTFKEWQLNETAYDFNTAVTADITLVATWIADEDITTYTVTFNSNGGSDVASQEIAEGEKATKPVTPTKEGYTFKEWQLDGKTYDFNTPVTKDVTLKAVWTVAENNKDNDEKENPKTGASIPTMIGLSFLTIVGMAVIIKNKRKSFL